jgi:DNA polymerase (family 10)
VRSNDLAAEALGELADLVAISGGDPYRVRAYEKAARSVAGCFLAKGRHHHRPQAVAS